ncbi:MAG TPA: hypothetical protein VFP85_04535, partial [Vicinamibacterales bacterium]|nr:hypothetical protein [Vicinamibacterales bacterium]
AVTPVDLAAARAAGGTIKPVVSAERDASGVRAFVGPAFVPATEPLAALGGALNGIRLDGRYISSLFFSGPGAGPDVTAATLLDDAAQAAVTTRTAPAPRVLADHPVFPSSPSTEWFIRLTFPGVLPAEAAATGAAAAAGLRGARICGHSSTDSRWLFVGPHSRREIDAAIGQLAQTHRVIAAAFRNLSHPSHLSHPEKP